jgi:hypothetical protein
MMRVFEHAKIGKRQLQQPFYFVKWYRCLNGACRTSTVTYDVDRQWNLCGQQREKLEQWLKQNAERKARSI